MDKRDNGEVQLIGKVFQEMEPSWKNEKLKISFSMFHSYCVSELSKGVSSFPATDVVGKGRCYCVDFDAVKAPNIDDEDYDESRGLR